MPLPLYLLRGSGPATRYRCDNKEVNQQQEYDDGNVQFGKRLPELAEELIKIMLPGGWATG